MLSKPTNKKFVTQRRASEQIEKYLYYQNHIYPDLFPNPLLSMEFIKSNKLIYYTSSFRSTQQILSNPKIILSSSFKTYLSNTQANKIDQNLFKKQTKVRLPYLMLTSVAQQIFDIKVINKSYNNSSIENGKQYELYIIHYCNSSQKSGIKWLHYVQCYIFYKTYFDYRLAASIKADGGLLNKNKQFFEQYLKITNITQNPKRMQGFLLQQQINLQIEIKKSSDPAFSAEHRVLNRICPENIKLYYTLQKQFPKYDQNLICRYLIAKQYNLDETRKAISQYHNWRQNIMGHWKYQDFQQFNKAGIFFYLGEDRSGRPVILNRACRVNVNQVDIDKYSYYYIYYLQIYIPSLMRGNVSQIMIIADVQNLSASNFKFSLTKRNMGDNLKYGPERQYKIIGVNVSNFALYWWRLISPLLPKRSLQKIIVAGADKNAIYEALQNEMSAEIIPIYLGGKNQIDVK